MQQHWQHYRIHPHCQSVFPISAFYSNTKNTGGTLKLLNFNKGTQRILKNTYTFSRGYMFQIESIQLNRKLKSCKQLFKPLNFLLPHPYIYLKSQIVLYSFRGKRCVCVCVCVYTHDIR